MPERSKEYYTAKELAGKLSLNVMTIYRYINSGKLKAYKIGKEFRIDHAEFIRFMDVSKTSK
jgi:excisionase family DNA binding protein